MTLEFRCPGCGRPLRIAPEHAGKQVRCPACQHISTAAIPGAASVATQTSPPATWHLKTPEGPIYGPIPWNELETWAAEGRVTAECQLSETTTGPWSPASDFLPQLLPPPKPQPTFTPPPPSTPPPSAFIPTGGYVAPHRGGLILALGLIGFIVSCPIVSLMAWVMGSHDLNEMRAGRMDRRGEGMTQAGQVLGLILSLLWIFCGVVTLVIFAIIAIAANL
jgi:ribosomal protein S27E